MTHRWHAFGIFVVVLSAACQSRHVMKEIPEALRGEWRTTDARYEDRGFVLSAKTVVFNTGQHTFAAHPIVAMDSIVEPGLIHFRLLYTAGSTDLFHFDFSYDPMDDAIRFRNQPEIVWRRFGPPDTAAPTPDTAAPTPHTAAPQGQGGDRRALGPSV
jgi:hypothetical protein